MAKKEGAKPVKATGKRITWKSVLVDISKIKPTPKNYKIKTDLGAERLRTSLKAFGLAGNVVCNTDFTLIDGNSRLEEAKAAGEKKLWVSIPNRKLSPKEFEEMSALFDFAKAGEVDIESIQKDLGKTEDFYKKWGIETPMAVLAQMGKGAVIEEVEVDDSKVATNSKKKMEVADIRMVQLFFTEAQEAEFRKWEQKAEKHFKTDNTTETVWKALKSIKFNR